MAWVYHLRAWRAFGGLLTAITWAYVVKGLVAARGDRVIGVAGVIRVAGKYIFI
jgi:hypothetical protein